ncbi:MAG: prolyl oligopeptidase family serine peptidase [Cyclobacteriaceae bacterium]|jgi:dipeptidyl aminopeptidase/acylaminoacyl peptidase|nr:prolyl oligopeptidase family serine peptidase [Cyclobacteriaceae bacterium]
MKKVLCILVWCGLALGGRAQEALVYQRPPEEIAQLVEATSTPAVVLSPDKSVMALLDRSDYPTIEELSRPELRIAGLRVNPDNFGPSRGSYFVGVKFKNVKDGKEYTVRGLPAPLQISNASFSPDSKKLAWLQTYPDRLEAWVIDLTGFTAKRISTRKINATLGNPLSWLSDSNTLLLLTVANTGSLPPKSRVPVGPVVEENLGKRAPSRTYQDLLKNPYDESVFDFICTSQLISATLAGEETLLGSPAVYNAQNPSPDGSLILTRTVQRPYSYLVPVNLFPQQVTVIDRQGKVVKRMADIPLADNIPLGFSATLKGPRGHAWRTDAAATLYWAEAQDGGDPKVKTDVRDKVFVSAAPFTQTTELVSLPLRYGGITWGNNQLAWVYENWWADRKERTYQINPSVPGTKKVVFDRSSEDAYTDPGNVLTTANSFGRPVIQVNADNSVYLTGLGSSPEGDRPFLDKMDLKTNKVTRLWRSETPYFEYVVSVLPGKKVTFITSRESATENPNYHLRTLGAKTSTQLTAFPHPYPQIKDVKKQVLKYKREDGVELTADLYVPANYKKEDGPLPAFFWAYPEEFKSKANAGQVKGSPHTFTRLNWGTPIYWVTRGYAILDNASIPIVGEGDQEPNDTYVQQLVASAKAAIDYGASLGVVDPKRVAAGGHSYGAFMTGNLLAHSDLFAAGIARSGAYNRTLTPFGFQAEERTYWQAPTVYFDMSPFSFADKLKEPILMIHGEADNNSGTFPIQSERFYNAIKGHGGTARFVLLPYESHGYRAKESVLHMLWEMDQWLEKYVKNANGPRAGIK